MPADTTGKTLLLMDLMLEFFADDNHWARDSYHDPHSRHCPIAAVLHFRAKHGLPRANNVPSQSGIAPAADRAVAFNDRLWRSAAELRSIVLKARAVRECETRADGRGIQAPTARRTGSRSGCTRGCQRGGRCGGVHACAVASSLELSDPAELDTQPRRTVLPVGIERANWPQIKLVVKDPTLDIQFRGRLSLTPTFPESSIMRLSLGRLSVTTRC